MSEIKLNAMESIFELFCRVPSNFLFPNDIRKINAQNKTSGSDFLMDEISAISSLSLGSLDTLFQVKRSKTVDKNSFIKTLESSVRILSDIHLILTIKIVEICFCR